MSAWSDGIDPEVLEAIGGPNLLRTLTETSVRLFGGTTLAIFDHDPGTVYRAAALATYERELVEFQEADFDARAASDDRGLEPRS